LEFIGESAFAGTAITAIQIPNSVRIVGNKAFADCRWLESVGFLPGGVKTLGKACFSNSGLRQLFLPSSIRSLGELCFDQCRELRTVEFAPDSTIDSLPLVVFRNCAIVEVSFPPSLRELGKECFADCDFLGKILLYSVTRIRARAFWGTRINSELIISDSLCEIAASMFGYSSVATVVISPTHPMFKVEQEMFLVSRSDESLLRCFVQEAGPELEVKFAILGPHCFGGVRQENTKVVCPNVKTIHSCAFHDAGLSEVSILSKVEDIESDAFLGRWPALQHSGPSRRRFPRLLFLC
jgi:hypothetical protein